MRDKLVSRPAFFVYATLLLPLLALLIWQRNNKEWPALPDQPGPGPTLMVEVERDFSHRIGDVIPVTIYIKEFPGTTVDIDGLALEGDFELRGDYKTDSRSTADGGRIIRLKAELQSFSINPKLRNRVSMQWATAGTKDWKEIDKFEFFLHTSKTWDGRDQIQEGKLRFLAGYHWLYTAAWLVLPVAGAIWLLLFIRRVRNEPQPVEPVPVPAWMAEFQWAQDRFNACWERLAAGERSTDIFQEIAHVVRSLLKVEAVESRYLDIVLDGHPQKVQAIYIILCCEQVAFRNRALTDEQVARIKPLFEDITHRRHRKLKLRIERSKRSLKPKPPVTNGTALVSYNQAGNASLDLPPVQNPGDTEGEDESDDVAPPDGTDLPAPPAIAANQSPPVVAGEPNADPPPASTDGK